MKNLSQAEPKYIRRLFRENKLIKPTSGMAQGHVQANLVVLPKSLAYDFLLFAQRNPKPCPILDVTDMGSPEPGRVAPGADLRFDIPQYRIYRNGELAAEVTDLESYWTEDMVGFLIGCSLTFETAFLRNGIPVRHIEEDHAVPMYITSIECNPAGAFTGPTVVSMRPIPEQMLSRAVQITSRTPAAHGAPIHIGSPGSIGIKDIDKPEFGEPVTIRAGEVPVFWACGVTPQAVAMKSKPEIMLAHAPGHMFICDIRDEDLAVI
jgi:uncharacterized protein YcsI (UPF0317 family)